MVTPVGAAAMALRVVGIGLALALAAVSLRAYRRRSSAMYRSACLGFLLLAAGLVVEAALGRVGDLPTTTVHAAEALLLALGLGALYLSLR